MNTSISKKVALFVECFGDSAEVAKELFSCRDVTTVCKYNEDRLAAMASLVPILADDKISGFYIYGVCVAENERGRGLFREIMQAAENKAVESGASFVCLIPADNRLKDTYMSFGYDIEVLPKGCNAGKKIRLLSDDFRIFARCDKPVSDVQMSGLIKSFDKNVFCPCDKEFVFLDDMGDV